jgi:hypothetical protein
MKVSQVTAFYGTVLGERLAMHSLKNFIRYLLGIEILLLVSRLYIDYVACLLRHNIGVKRRDS